MPTFAPVLSPDADEVSWFDIVDCDEDVPLAVAAVAPEVLVLVDAAINDASVDCLERDSVSK